METRYSATAPRCFRRDYDQVHEAIRPFVVWHPWPHPGDDCPDDLLSIYRRLNTFGYANGWLS